ncbi:hypothetical protein SAMN05216486_1199 [bacterium JGI 053]|nr:hypothetical protein SAMN05216486_1199 [bacterium JGI 053]
MPKLRVAFDTNVYRGISEDRFEELRRLERAHSVVGVSTYWVAAELLSHLASDSDPSFNAALAGLRRLILHCRKYNGSQYSLRFLGDVDSQIAYTLFGTRLFTDQDSPYDLAWLVGRFAPEGELNDSPEHVGILIDIAHEVKIAELRFAQNIWENMVLKLIPDAQGWTDLARNKTQREKALEELASPEAERVTAQVLIDRVAAKLGREISADEREAKVEELRETLIVPIRLQNALFARILRDGLDLSKGKHSNTLWDLHIVFCASTFTELDRTPFCLVTDDRPILRAAQEGKVADGILSLAEYEAALKKHTLPQPRPLAD